MASKKAIIVYNVTQTDEKFKLQIDEFVKTFAKIKIDLFEVDNAHAEDFVKNHKKIRFVLFYDKDIRLAFALEKQGYKVYNSSEVIRICDDKGLTQVILESNGIPTPKTRVLPDMLGQNISFYFNSIAHILNGFEYPFVLKERIGSFGEQVYLIEDKEQLKVKLVEIGHKPLLIQEYIECSSGKDYRAYAIKKEVIVVRRENEHDFRSNVNQGGTMSRYTGFGYAKIRKLAIKTAKALGAKFVGVDIVFDNKHRPLVLEVNSNARTLCAKAAAKKDITLKIAKLIKKDSR